MRSNGRTGSSSKALPRGAGRLSGRPAGLRRPAALIWSASRCIAPPLRPTVGVIPQREIRRKAASMSIFLAHRGLGNDGPLWLSTADGFARAGDQQVQNVGRSESPPILRRGERSPRCK